jgi:hypothetical protein
MRPQQFYGDCVGDLRLDGNIIQKCMQGELGKALQVIAEKETVIVLDKIPGVPTVVFDDKINETESTMSLDAFSTLVEWKLRNVTEDF